MVLAGDHGGEVSVTTEPAAIDLACVRSGIKHVVVCGHSDCKVALLFYRSHCNLYVDIEQLLMLDSVVWLKQAMNQLLQLHRQSDVFNNASPLHLWLRRHGYSSLAKLDSRLKDGGQKAISFIADNPQLSFDAFIDADERWGVQDKLSQACLTPHFIVKFIWVFDHMFLYFRLIRFSSWRISPRMWLSEIIYFRRKCLRMRFGLIFTPAMFTSFLAINAHL